MKYVLLTAMFGLLGIACGCQSTGDPTTTQPANVSADGRNLTPALQKDFGHDPQWPNDADPASR
jgi:hypothetical protein